MERLCVNCKHQDVDRREYLGPFRCYALRGKTSPVNGLAIESMEAGLMRLTLCGWNDPKFWEPKPRASTE